MRSEIGEAIKNGHVLNYCDYNLAYSLYRSIMDWLDSHQLDNGFNGKCISFFSFILLLTEKRADPKITDSKELIVEFFDYFWLFDGKD